MNTKNFIAANINKEMKDHRLATWLQRFIFYFIPLKISRDSKTKSPRFSRWVAQ